MLVFWVVMSSEYTDVSEEHIASIFRAEDGGTPHGVTTQKTNIDSTQK
jgi:hypothetical protein